MKLSRLGAILVLVGCLCTFSGFAAAVDETKTITDNQGDVVSYYDTFYSYEGGTTYVTEHDDIEVDNIDIKEVVYDLTGTTVTLTMEVYGEIEDRGDIEDTYYNYELDLDVVSYYFLLQMDSENTYAITYVNQAVNNTYGTASPFEYPETEFIVDGGLLTITFELQDDTEMYEELATSTRFMKIDFSAMDGGDDDEYQDYSDLFIILEDNAPDLPLTLTDVDVISSPAEVGQTVEFEAYVYFGQEPYEYLWDFGDGDTSTEARPTHVYQAEGTYDIGLTVTDNLDTEETWDSTIEILPTDDDDEVTPGFELLIVLGALSIFLLWRKKR